MVVAEAVEKRKPEISILKNLNLIEAMGMPFKVQICKKVEKITTHFMLSCILRMGCCLRWH